MTNEIHMEILIKTLPLGLKVGKIKIFNINISDIFILIPSKFKT